MAEHCKECDGTNVQTLEWVYPNTETKGDWPHTVEIANGDPFSSGQNPDYNYCDDCQKHVELVIKPERIEYIICMEDGTWTTEVHDAAPVNDIAMKYRKAVFVGVYNEDPEDEET